MSGQVVDTESAREFMKEALAKTSEAEIDAICAELREKSRRFRAILAAGGELGEDELRRVLRSVFSTRRSAEKILKANPSLATRIHELLHSRDDLTPRFETFCEALRGVDPSVPYDLASELLHYTRPDEYWLWTRWMWNPANETGALRLVTMDGYDLRGAGLGETYLKVGEAVAFVAETAKAVGFQRRDTGLFGTTVYLVLVYVIYMYTTLRLRMTQEFNQVVPALPELSRRILGVHYLEV